MPIRKPPLDHTSETMAGRRHGWGQTLASPLDHGTICLKRFDMLPSGGRRPLRCHALGPGQSVDVAVDVERIRSALLRPGAGLSELLVDVTAGFISEHDAKLAFAGRRRFLPDDHCVEDWQTTNAIRGIGTGRREPDAKRH